MPSSNSEVKILKVCWTTANVTDYGALSSYCTYPIIKLNKAETKSDMDWISAYPYLYLFCLTNTNTDMDIIQMQNFISKFVLNGCRYNLNIESMDIIMDMI